MRLRNHALKSNSTINMRLLGILGVSMEPFGGPVGPWDRWDRWDRWDLGTDVTLGPMGPNSSAMYPLFPNCLTQNSHIIKITDYL